MIDTDLEALFARVRAWPEDLQAEATDLLLALERDAEAARALTPDALYPLTDEEIAELRTAMLETDEASDAEITAAFGRSFR